MASFRIPPEDELCNLSSRCVLFGLERDGGLSPALPARVRRWGKIQPHNLLGGTRKVDPLPSVLLKCKSLRAKISRRLLHLS